MLKVVLHIAGVTFHKACRIQLARIPRYYALVRATIIVIIAYNSYRRL